MRIYHYLFVFGLICLALAAAGLLQGRFSTVVSKSSNPALEALLAAYADVPSQFDAPSRTSDCQVKGPLPDHDCSPGAIFASSTLEEICTTGYSASVRNVSVTLKKKIYAAYGIAYPQPTGSIELDHIIPLELGGSNAAANLFPEAAAPEPGFREKDVVEDYLHLEVCAGRVSLQAAQHQIADNWVAVYQTLSPGVIASIKQHYRSWAQ